MGACGEGSGHRAQRGGPATSALALHSLARPPRRAFLPPSSAQDRLERELERNLALRVEPGEGAESFEVSGRG